MKWVCQVCGYVYEGDAAPAECPICHAGADKFKKVEDGAMTLAAEPTDAQGTTEPAAQNDAAAYGVRQHVPELLVRFDHSQILRRPFVERGAGGRAVHERVGKNGRKQQRRRRFVNDDVLFVVHLINDGGSGAQGLPAEKNGAHGLHGGDAVMINDL